MRKSINILFVLLAGCAGKTAPSIAPANPLPASPPDRDFPVAIRLASHQTASPANAIAPEAVYGLWLREDGKIRTWVRIESPRIHLVLVDKGQGIGRVMDGEYTLARDGTLFGVISTVENISRKEEVDALYAGENLSTVRNGPFAVPMPPDKQQRIMPFIVTPRQEGGDLVLDGETLFQGRYRKIAETRPTFSRPLPPLGKWQNQNWEVKVRTTIRLADKIEVEMLDQITGRRVRLSGEYGVTAGNLLYGFFHTLDQSQGTNNAPQPIPPQIFCCHYAAAAGNLLQIRDLTAACFDDKARDLLQRDYHRVQEQVPASHERAATGRERAHGR